MGTRRTGLRLRRSRSALTTAIALLGTLGAVAAVPVIMSAAFASNATAPSTTAAPGVAVLAAASADNDPILIASSPTTERDRDGSPSAVHGNPHVVTFAVAFLSIT